jgi:hypothetical protein
MTPQQVTESLQMLVDAFPSFGRWWEENSADWRGTSLKQLWCRVLAGTHAADATKVIDDLVMGRVEMPKNYEYDRLAIVIRREADFHATRREESRRVERYRPRRENMTEDMETEIGRFNLGMRLSTQWEYPKRKRNNTPEEKQQLAEIDADVAVIKDWYAGRGELPERLLG